MSRRRRHRPKAIGVRMFASRWSVYFRVDTGDVGREASSRLVSPSPSFQRSSAVRRTLVAMLKFFRRDCAHHYHTGARGHRPRVDPPHRYRRCPPLDTLEARRDRHRAVNWAAGPPGSQRP
jgi:hypothetical protein